MKNIILYIVSMAFMANTLIVSADVKLCMQEQTNNVIHLEMLTESEMPCHEEQQNEDKKHCKDACFCLIYSANQTPHIKLGDLNAVNTHEERFVAIDEYAVSNYLSLLYRPPIYYS
ncbi:MAG: hypothetical protein R8G33_07345 [Gammaproteobacteria bacterium]|nr:hypothetical protein [Gammaproteobacteria bacterium]